MKHRAAVPDTWETASESGTGWGSQDSAQGTVTVGRHAAPVQPEDEEAEPPGLDMLTLDPYAEYAYDLVEELVLSAARPEARRAATDVLDRPTDAVAGPQPDPVHETIDDPVADIPDTRPEHTESLPAYVIPHSATWKSRHLGRTLLSIVTVAVLVATVPTAVYYWQMRTDDRMNLLVVMSTFGIGLWSILASRRRQVVSLRGSLLTVKGRCLDETFDLADALQRVELSGHPRKLRWSLTLARTDKSELVLHRRDVDALQLEPIVRYYRELAERRRDRQWNELGLHGASR